VPHTVIAALAGLDCDDFSAIPRRISVGFPNGQKICNDRSLGRVNAPWHIFFAEAVELLVLVNAYRVDAGNFLADISASGQNLLPYVTSTN
jgi:hypothetical protein